MMRQRGGQGIARTSDLIVSGGMGPGTRFERIDVGFRWGSAPGGYWGLARCVGGGGRTGSLGAKFAVSRHGQGRTLSFTGGSSGWDPGAESLNHETAPPGASKQFRRRTFALAPRPGREAVNFDPNETSQPPPSASLAGPQTRPPPYETQQRILIWFDNLSSSCSHGFVALAALWSPGWFHGQANDCVCSFGGLRLWQALGMNAFECLAMPCRRVSRHEVRLMF